MTLSTKTLSKAKLHHKKPSSKILLSFPRNLYNKTSNAHASNNKILANPYYHTTNNIISHKKPTTIDIHIITMNTSHICSSLPGILELIQAIQEKPTKTSKLPSSRNLATQTYIHRLCRQQYQHTNALRGKILATIYEIIHPSKMSPKFPLWPMSLPTYKHLK